MTKNNSEKLYQKAVGVADLITKEMSWLYANHQVFKAGNEDQVIEKFKNTYSGHIWKLIRRSTLNEIHHVLFKLIDSDVKTASVFSLKNLLKSAGVLDLVQQNYSQSEDAFQEDKGCFDAAMQELEKYMRDNQSTVKKLIRHRHNYLAHRSAKPYKNEDNLKIGDEKELIKIVSDIVEPMEALLLNRVNISYSINSPYELYAKSFWTSFSPEKENEWY